MTFQVLPESLNGNANILLEIAGLLQAGRPEPSLVGRAKAPAVHPEVAAAVTSFTTFAQDQYRDAVALMAALSTRLTQVAANYVDADEVSAQQLKQVGGPIP